MSVWRVSSTQSWKSIQLRETSLVNITFPFSMFLTCLIFFSVILLAWKAQPVSPDPWTGTPGMCIPLLELFLTSWTSKYSSPGPYIHSQPFPFGPHSCKDVCIYLIVETGEVFSDWELKVLVKSSTWIFVRPGFELCTLRLCWIGIIKCEAFKANLPVAPPPPKKAISGALVWPQRQISGLGLSREEVSGELHLSLGSYK